LLATGSTTTGNTTTPTASTNGSTTATAEHDCYLVCCANFSWVWHTQTCSLRMLEMAQAVARQLQVVAGASNYTASVIQGQETPAFVQALTKIMGGLESDTNSSISSEDSSDQEMTGNPQEMSME